MSESTLTGRLSAKNAPARVVPRTLTATARVWLLAIVATSFVLRVLASRPHTTAYFFPDEYIYSSLARSLAHGEITIRGTSAHFPALLAPILAAPGWWLNDPELAYRTTQLTNSLAMSLAAVPTYLLARYVGVNERRALLSAAFAVAVPGLLYASFITADAVAYPLAVTGVLLAVRALDKPSAGRQVSFLAIATVCVFARVQYAVLVPVFLAATVIVCNGRPSRIAKTAGIVLLAVAAAVVVLMFAGLSRVTGYYSGSFALGLDLGGAGRWVAIDGMLMAFASGVVLVPVAVAGLVHAFHRRSCRAERSFASVTSFLVAALLLESVWIGSGTIDRFYERYLLAVFPLLPIAFCLGVSHFPRGRFVASGVALALLLAAMIFPVSEFTVATGQQDSPFLRGVSLLEERIGGGNAALVVALAVTSLAIVAIVHTWRQRGTTLLLIMAIAVTGIAASGAVARDAELSSRIRETYLPGDRKWIDHARTGSTSMLVFPGDDAATMFDLFWNTNLDRVLLMPGADPIDAFGSERVEIGNLGQIRLGSAPLQGAFVVRGNWATANIWGARPIARNANATLWDAAGRRPRLSLLTLGRYSDGWLDTRTRITAWPRGNGARDGVLHIRLGLPAGFAPVEMTMTAGRGNRVITVYPGKVVTIRLPLHFSGEPVHIELHGNGAAAVGGRAVTVRAEPPTLSWVSPARA